MNTVVSSTATATERFGFTLFFATALHAVAIIGISFTAESKAPPQRTIEVTLAQFQEEKAPEKADFIAQSNQQGSGRSEEKLLPSTPQKASIQDSRINHTAPAQPLQTAPVQQAQPAPASATKETPKQAPVSQPKPVTEKKVVTSTQPKPRKAAEQQKQRATSQPQPQETNGATSLLARSLKMASLQAELDAHREMEAKRPRVKRLTSASTQKREDARYLNNWRKKIEKVGNLNYPEEARRNKLYGSLRLLVAIEPDGSVRSVEILESSGQPVLDDAAIRIVRLAAPFQPFPVEMRKNTDILEIIRTWKFEKKARVY